MIYIPKWFNLRELIPKRAWENHRNNSNIWFIFDNRVLLIADYIRRDYGRILVNDWQWGGENEYSGWRPFDCEVGAKLSQHKFGRALDLHPQDATAEEIRQDILDKKKPYMSLIRGLELEVHWLHIDTRNYETPDILTFTP